MQKITMFNPAWQLTRVKARDIKIVENKIKFILDYFNKNKTISDQKRVINWLKMTKAGYRNLPNSSDKKFDEALEKVQDIKCTKFDNSSTIKDLSKEEIELILKDLNSRKYNFQYKKVPQEHTEFVGKLKNALSSV